jgi:hypothetical protein
MTDRKVEVRSDGLALKQAPACAAALSPIGVAGLLDGLMVRNRPHIGRRHVVGGIPRLSM